MCEPAAFRAGIRRMVHGIALNDAGPPRRAELLLPIFRISHKVDSSLPHLKNLTTVPIIGSAPENKNRLSADWIQLAYLQLSPAFRIAKICCNQPVKQYDLLVSHARQRG